MNLVGRIVTEVAEQEDTPCSELAPMHEILDPEALQELVISAEDDALIILFDYCGHIVQVYGDGSVTVIE